MLTYQNILWFQILMNDVNFVQIFQSFENIWSILSVYQMKDCLPCNTLFINGLSKSDGFFRMHCFKFPSWYLGIKNPMLSGLVDAPIILMILRWFMKLNNNMLLQPFHLYLNKVISFKKTETSPPFTSFRTASSPFHLHENTCPNVPLS